MSHLFAGRSSQTPESSKKFSRISCIPYRSHWHSTIYCQPNYVERGAETLQISEHPRIELTVCPRDKMMAGVTIMAVADSGAMSNLWGMHQYLDSESRKDDLRTASLEITAANKNKMNKAITMMRGKSPQCEKNSHF